MCLPNTQAHGVWVVPALLVAPNREGVVMNFMTIELWILAIKVIILIIEIALLK